MDLRIGPVLTLVIAALLLGGLIPSILGMLYLPKSDTTNKAYGFDQNWSAIGTDLNITNMGSVQVIWRILPVFFILGAIGIMYAIIRLEYL